MYKILSMNYLWTNLNTPSKHIHATSMWMLHWTVFGTYVDFTWKRMIEHVEQLHGNISCSLSKIHLSLSNIHLIMETHTLKINVRVSKGCLRPAKFEGSRINSRWPVWGHQLKCLVYLLETDQSTMVGQATKALYYSFRL